MNRAEFKALILDHLERMEEAELEAALPGERESDLFADLFIRFRHARAAFPGMTWEEFNRISQRRSEPPRSRGRPKADIHARASTPMSRAARDVDHIKTLWRQMQPAGSRAAPPVPPVEIAAERHGVDEAALGERVRRPNSRRPDRLIRRP